MAECGTVIYRRGSKSPGSTSDDSSDGLWDDKVLIDLYDKALNVAQEEVAKRYAMSTNTNKGASNKKESKKQIENKSSKYHKKNWKIGSECRAIYDEDGLEYEASILKINGDSCEIVFLGYENVENVKLDELKPSLGKYHRMQQSMDADELNPVDIKRHLKKEISAAEQGTHIKSKNKKSKDVKANLRKYPVDGLPELSSFLPLPFSPNASFDSHMPLPPPPFLPPMNAMNSTEDQTLSSMLISWYMSGYYTGLYQGQKMAKKNN